MKKIFVLLSVLTLAFLLVSCVPGGPSAKLTITLESPNSVEVLDDPQEVLLSVKSQLTDIPPEFSNVTDDLTFDIFYEIRFGTNKSSLTKVKEDKVSINIKNISDPVYINHTFNENSFNYDQTYYWRILIVKVEVDGTEIVRKRNLPPVIEGSIQINEKAEYALTVTANPAEGGEVTGAGNYELGETATITATPNAEYNFVNWTIGETVLSTSATYDYTMPGNAVEITANFSKVKYALTVTADPAEGGEVTGAGNYELGETATITATPNAEYNFVNWTIGETVLSTSATYDYTMPGNAVEITANFSKVKYALTVTADPVEGGEVTGAGNYELGETATITATANEGYKFVNWTIGEIELSTIETYDYTMPGNAVEITANFELKIENIEGTYDDFVIMMDVEGVPARFIPDIEEKIAEELGITAFTIGEHYYIKGMDEAVLTIGEQDLLGNFDWNLLYGNDPSGEGTIDEDGNVVIKNFELIIQDFDFFGELIISIQEDLSLTLEDGNLVYSHIIVITNDEIAEKFGSDVAAEIDGDVTVSFYITISEDFDAINPWN